jgi:hypothetical protein
LAWGQERAWRLLHGEVSQGVHGRRLSATKRELRGQKDKVVAVVAGSFYRNRRHRRDDAYLCQGRPIATGGVEGARKNLVKDRMERSGMRWTPTVAEAMLKLGAVYLSSDFEPYWAFHVAQAHEHFHPPGHWRPVHPIEEKAFGRLQLRRVRRQNVQVHSRRARSPASRSFNRNLLALDPGPFDLEEARADQADLDRLLLHGRVNPDPEQVRGLRLRLRDGLTRAIDVDPEGVDVDPDFAFTHLPAPRSTYVYALRSPPQHHAKGIA